jgi:hypothetical protein
MPVVFKARLAHSLINIAKPTKNHLFSKKIASILAIIIDKD